MRVFSCSAAAMMRNLEKFVMRAATSAAFVRDRLLVARPGWASQIRVEHRLRIWLGTMPQTRPGAGPTIIASRYDCRHSHRRVSADRVQSERTARHRWPMPVAVQIDPAIHAASMHAAATRRKAKPKRRATSRAPRVLRIAVYPRQGMQVRPAIRPPPGAPEVSLIDATWRRSARLSRPAPQRYASLSTSAALISGIDCGSIE
jgi:hypothetical protein